MVSVYSSESKFFKLKRVFFPDIMEINTYEIVDVVRFLRGEHNLEERFGISKDCAFTLISSLDNDKAMLEKMNKTVRYEIKRCMTRDNVSVHVYFSDYLRENRTIIADFKSVYDHFCEISKQPQLKGDFNLTRINEYINSDCAFVSVVEYEHGKTYHMYIVDDKNALLVYSASDFRNPEVDNNLAARANKYLHFTDMCQLRDLGYKKYDWGNVSSFDEPNGIDVFKMGFGGEQKTLYNYFVGQSLKGKLLVEAKKLLKR